MTPAQRYQTSFEPLELSQAEYEAQQQALKALVRRESKEWRRAARNRAWRIVAYLAGTGVLLWIAESIQHANRMAQ